MVHRHPDSRLLASLISAESSYSKQLQSLLAHSASSLAAFSAYAAASAPPTSHVIISVATCLANVDGAVEGYYNALEEWKACLKQVKEAEDEVSNILRDRDILVTRLLKASKSGKSNRDSLVNMRASMSETSLGSSGFTPSGKLASAQTELQACEAQLSVKEKELEEIRVGMIKKGLEARCRALVQCAATCGEMGREALGALDHISNFNPSSYKPLPLPNSDQTTGNGQGGPPSDLSSLTPSQSASQVHLSLDDPAPSRRFSSVSSSNVHVHVPPAHSISEFVLPHALERRITEEPEGGSSESEEEGPVEVRENERFARPANPKRASTFSVRGGDRGHVRFPTSVSDVGPVWEAGHEDKRRTRSKSFFGGLATLWRGKSHADSYGDTSDRLGNKKGWQTRTDRNLRKRRDSSSDEEGPSTRGIGAAGSLKYGPDGWSSVGGSATPGGTQRLKKRTPKRESLQDKGWMSDGAAASGSNTGTIRRSTKGKEREVNGGPPPAFTSASNTRETKSILTSGFPPGGSGTLSRDSSISKRSTLSAASAPSIINTSRIPAKAGPARSNSVTAHGKRGGSLDTQRPNHGSSSLNESSSTATVTWADSPSSRDKGKTAGSSTIKSQRRLDGLPNSGSQSLMSIVEDVSKMNRVGFTGAGTDLKLEMPRAPPPVTRERLEAELAQSEPSPSRSQSRLSRSNSATAKSASRPSATLAPTVHQPVPGMKPLKSALRTSSRSPSPAAPQRTQLYDNGPSSLSNGDVSNGNAAQNGGGDDAASIMSFETAHEVFDDDPSPTPRSRSPDGTDLSTSTASTATKVSAGAAPVRRKSVRMSLEPTFSPTPPALDDSERHEPWSDARSSAEKPRRAANDADADGWAMRNGRKSRAEEKDVWDDSSAEEDEEYGLARRLLAKTGKGY
ncbi:hypothetical protein GLOTRDRAFT_139985 [Gloeophyllum trabeum ATCC 11539]|uniref:Uncharacterized protein n=1 Tax=Gloeophyllum trabeum (strain ATCC 11539 / FP-39264 / Madison 617) TaxID=670483 RepID=S7RFS7_GLOTA|nr:uncharacterized protein GLOTRDRAFT_139985 [Gloeophyllum trabeum ATCC 11539]EPQ53035.1 hypothetical protein GLOTRDRAFT_139985 [Gloeophyllum trabeum ATCC 11539]